MKKLLAGVMALCSFAAYAAEPCGGMVELSGNTVKTPKPLTGATKEDACVTEIGKLLAANPDVSGATVELRVKDDERVGGKALTNAKRVAGLLTAAGVKNVSALVPRADGLELGLVIVPSMKPPPAPVAQLAQTEGTVNVGREAASLKPSGRGAGIPPGDLVQPLEKSGAIVSIPDVAKARVLSDASVRVKVDGEGKPAFEVLKGLVRVKTDAAVTVIAGGAGTISVSPKSVVDVDVNGDVWTVSVHEGKAERKSEAASTAIAAGHALHGTGATSEEAKPLLAMPEVKPTFGDAAAKLEWKPVTGAKNYRVELGRTPEFGAGTQVASVDATSTDALPSMGKWFYRVYAVGPDGALGQPSKVYSFTR